MMGAKVRSFAPLPDDLSLEDLVPKDHFYRRLQARLDLSFVRELVGPLYANGGRPSVDPVVFFKLQLVMFFEDIRSERQLMRVVADRLSVRWYLVEDRLQEHLAGVFPQDASLDPTEERPAAVVVAGAVGPEGDERRALARKNALRHRWIEKAGRQERAVARWGYTRMADMRVSTTDPDATPTAPEEQEIGQARLPYPLRRGRWQGEGGPERAGHGSGGHGEPTHATDAL